MNARLTIAILILTSAPVWAQNRGGNTNFPTNGGTGSGLTGGQTGTGAGIGGGGTTGLGGFGSGFSFDPNFGTTTMANPFGNAANGSQMSPMRTMGIGMGMGMGMGMGGFGMGGMGGMGGGMGGFGMQQQQSQTKVRPTVVLGFEVARPSSQQRAQTVRLTLDRLPQAQRFAGVAVEIDGSRAVVSGSLKDPKDAELLRQLLLLEPGVYQVDMQQLNNDTPDVQEASPSNRDSSGLREVRPSPIPNAEIVPAPQP